MFQLPQSANEDVEGSTRQNPIMLPNNITYPDFHNFLKALYPLYVSVLIFYQNRMTDDYALHDRPVSTQLVLSRDEWLSVLRLSTFWYFLEYRKMAISQLEKVGAFSPIDQVLYGREYRVHSWVRQGFEQLITRENPIEKEDAHLINFETTFSLFRLRERRTKCLSSGFLSTFNTSDEVHQTFKTELEDIIKDEVACKTVEQEIMFEETSLPSKRPADDSFEGLWGVPEPTTMTTTVPTGLGKKKKKHYGKSW